MAHLKLIAPMVIALFAIVLEADAERQRNSFEISEQFWIEVGKDLSPEDQADATKAFSFVNGFFGKLKKSEAREAAGLFDALKQVLLYPDQCNELSLKHVALISTCSLQYLNTQYEEPARGLIEVIKKYANKCLTKKYITDKIQSKVSGCFLTNCFKPKVDFIDEDFIADYWSDHREDWPMDKIRPSKAAKAVAKAIIRERKNNIEDLKTEDQVHAYLNKRLYKPCFKSSNALSYFMLQIRDASLMLEGGQRKLVSSLEKSEQEFYFRYKLCSDIDFRVRWWNETIDGEVLSALKSLPTSQS